jgi:hypothetical protein
MDNYVKLFDLSWIEPWLVEALAVIALALLLAMIISRLAIWFNGENQ